MLLLYTIFFKTLYYGDKAFDGKLASLKLIPAIRKELGIEK